MSDTTEALEAELREYAGPIIEGGYKPFDQDERIRQWRHWRNADVPGDREAFYADVEAWEAGHGHDVRLKCYPEFQCQAIETHLESLITRALDALAAARTENERLLVRAENAEREERRLREAHQTVFAERDEARAALANIAGMVEPWDWIPMRGDVLSEVDRILPARKVEQ